MNKYKESVCAIRSSTIFPRRRLDSSATILHQCQPTIIGSILIGHNTTNMFMYEREDAFNIFSKKEDEILFIFFSTEAILKRR